jgi:hypothetical protein
MDAYGHSQIREFIVGSTTTKLARNTPVRRNSKVVLPKVP